MTSSWFILQLPMMFSSQNFVTIQLYPRLQYLLPIQFSVIFDS